MAGKIVNRKELRAEVEAAERAKPKKAAKAKKAAAKKKAKPRKSRAKVATPTRMKAYWGVFSQSLKRVALYEYADREAADQKAADLSQSGKSPHFVQPVREAIEE